MFLKMVIDIQQVMLIQTIIQFKQELVLYQVIMSGMIYHKDLKI